MNRVGGQRNHQRLGEQRELELPVCHALPEGVDRWSSDHEKYERHCVLLLRAHEDGTPHRDRHGKEWAYVAPPAPKQSPAYISGSYVENMARRR